MKGVNKVTILGHVGKEPDIKVLPGNIPVATCSVATSEFYVDKNGVEQEHTEWHQLVLWRKLALIARDSLEKGSHIFAVGKLRTTANEDKYGKKKYKTEILVEELIILTGKKENSTDLPGIDPAEKIVPPLDDNGKEILPFS